MSNVKASVYIPALQKHLGDGYVYGTVGQTCTIALLKTKFNQYGSEMQAHYYQKNGDYTKGLCARWLGKWVADCSGLIKAVRRDLTGVYKDVSAQGTYNQCTQKGKIATMPKVPGCTVYMWSSSRKRMGHVGMYIGNGKVIESRGVAYGVVQTNLSGRSWGYWGLLDWLDLDLPNEDGGVVINPGSEAGGSDNTGEMPDDKPCDGVPSLEGLGDTGYTVTLLQQWLNLHGANPPLVVDGDFGAKTEAAVNAFKGSKNLPNDGIACIQTWSALIVPPPAVQLLLDTVKMGDSGVLVTLVQRILYTVGITPWGITGIFDSNTLAAVKAFQYTRRLTVDGIVGPKTWAVLTNLLSALPRTVKMGDSGPEVEQVQAMLYNLGYTPGAQDGEFAMNTDGAVKAFQTDKGLVADGVVGPKTWTALLS